MHGVRCKQCRREFTAKRQGARFCSAKCRFAHWDRRNPRIMEDRAEAKKQKRDALTASGENQL